MTIDIPQQLKNENFRFILIGQQSKIPLETNWQNSNNYKFNDEKLLKHLEQNNNYGLVAGYDNIRIIDIDDELIATDFLTKNVFNTLTIKTGSGRGVHFIIRSDYNTNHRFINGIGEFRANNQQVVCANSIHPSGGKYQIINDKEIQYIDKTTLLKILKSILEKNGVVDISKQEIVDKEFIENKILIKVNDTIKTLIKNTLNKESLNVYGFPSRSERDQKVINYLVFRGFGKYIESIFKLFPIGDKYNEHPNPKKYLEHSINEARNFTGVKDDLPIYLEDEINNLNERVLRGKLDEYLLKISEISNWGDIKFVLGLIAIKLKISKRELEKRIEDLKRVEEDNVVMNGFEIFKLQLPEVAFYVNKLIPKNTFIQVQGKPNTFKSFFVLLLVLHLKYNRKFLDNFEAIEIPQHILYYDLENHLSIIKDRLIYSINGLEEDITTLNNGFTFKKNFKTTKVQNEIEFCKEYDLIILDSYRRFLDGDENKSEITNKFYTDFIKKLLDSGKTVITIMHEKKGGNDDILYTGQDLEATRGSGDIGAQADLCLQLLKFHNSTKVGSRILDLCVNITKNRKGLDIKPFSFKVIQNMNEKKTTLIDFKELEEIPSPQERLKSKILDFIKEHDSEEGVKTSDIVMFVTSKTEYRERWVKEALSRFVESGVLFKRTHGNYSYSM